MVARSRQQGRYNLEHSPHPDEEDEPILQSRVHLVHIRSGAEEYPLRRVSLNHRGSDVQLDRL